MNSDSSCSPSPSRSGSGSLFVVKKREDESDSEYFEATRDISVGEILFDETPIFQLPYNENIIICCLSCSSSLEEDKSRRRVCSECRWPICSDECEQLWIHRENECFFLSSNKIKYSPEMDIQKGLDLPLIAAGIRAFIVKKKNPELWEQLQNLCLGLDNIKTTRKWNPNHFGRFIIRHLHRLNSPKEKKEFKAALKTGYKLLEILRHKGFARLLFEYFILDADHTTEEYNNPNIPRYRGNYLFVKAGKMTHSCSPNTIWKVGDAPEFKLRLRALAPISKGEELTLSRIAGEVAEIQGTIPRREYLQEFRGIECKCARCSSPSEFGSFISGIRCNFCTIQNQDPEKDEDEQSGKKKESRPKSESGEENKNSGYFLPVFDESGQKMLFRCNRCSKEVPSSDLLQKLNEVEEKFDAFPDILCPSFSAAGLIYLEKLLQAGPEI